MAVICRASELLFIMTPRTGCTALGELLCRELGGEYLPETDIIGANGNITVQKKHSTLSQLLDRGLLSQEDRGRLCVFAAVRNPFDSLVSLYVKKSKTYQPLLDDPDSWVHRVAGYAEDMRYCRTHTFDEWIDKQYGVGTLGRWLRRGRGSLYRKYIDGVDAVIRFENLQEEFNQLLGRQGIELQLTIPRQNTTPQRRANYQEYYCPRSRKLVEQAFAEDLRRFAYQF